MNIAMDLHAGLVFGIESETVYMVNDEEEIEGNAIIIYLGFVSVAFIF